MSAITYSLLNKRNEPVIYSLDQSENGQSLTLAIQNKGTQAIGIKPFDQDPSTHLHHFAICFQPGFLSQKTLTITEAKNGQTLLDVTKWEIFYQVYEEDKSDRFYIIYRGDDPIKLAATADSPLQLQLSGISVADSMTTQHIRTLLRFNSSPQHYFDPVPSPASIQHLITVQEDLPYHIREIGQASRDFETKLGEFEFDDPKDFMTDEELAQFKLESVNQKFGTLITKTATKITEAEERVVGQMGPMIDEALIEVEGEMRALRNKTIVPLIAHIKEGWNFVPPVNTGVSLTIQILPNVDFFSLDDLQKKFIVRARPGAEIIYFCPKFDITVDSVSIADAADGVSWTIHKENTDVGLGRIENHDAPEEISKDRILELELTLKPRAGSTLDLSSLVLIFNNFEFVNSDGSTNTLAGFDLHLPLYVGPLQVSDDHLEMNGKISTKSLESYNRQSGADASVSNAIVVAGGRYSDQWINFRRGGASPGGEAGALFSWYGVSHFFMRNNGGLRVDHLETASKINNPNVGDENTKNLLTLSTNGHLLLNSSAEDGTLMEIRQEAESGADAGLKIRGSRNASTTDTAFIELANFDNNEGDEGTDFTMARISGSMIGTSGQKGALLFYTNGGGTGNDEGLQERMRIDERGQVGIGVEVPHASLHLENLIKNRKIVLYESADNDHQYYGFGINEFTLRYQIPRTGSNHAHKFYAGNGASGSNELMRIQGDGKVGIGASSPLSAKLEVNGGVRVGDGADTDGNLLLKLQSARPWEFRQIGTGPQSSLQLINVNSDGDESNKHFVINTQGRVGIGSISNNAKLNVDGTIKADTLRIGNVEISESELRRLKKLVNNELIFKLKTYRGLILDNNNYNKSNGHKNRTIQFRDDVSSDWDTEAFLMKMELKPGQ